MKSLDLTLPTAAENLACDEALLDFCENAGGGEVLRFWEPRDYFVVVGYANRVATEVNQSACESNGIPIFRRCSGGGAVLQGPGCLNYSLILKIDEAGPLRGITSANRFIMEKNRAAIESEISGHRPEVGISIGGHTDLTLYTPHPGRRTPLKFSGNAQRRKKNHLLFHGTFLLRFDLGIIEKTLAMPSKQPDYRHNRAHKNFLASLELPAAPVKCALRDVWRADAPLEKIPRDAIAALARDKYATKEWNFKF